MKRYETYEYECLENDNTIKIIFDEDYDEIDEIHIGCKDAPKDGWSVIGIHDLREALDMVRFRLVAKAQYEAMQR